MSSIFQTTIHQLRGNDLRECLDELAVEEPLEITLIHGSEATHQTLAITMRTPGYDQELALGFLFAEGIIQQLSQVQELHVRANHVTVRLAQHVVLDLPQLTRHVYTTSSCGICGKTSLESPSISPACTLAPALPMISAAVLYRLPERMRQAQTLFEVTGGAHAAALFDPQGQLLYLKEDVGRHNALDKLVGQMLLNHDLPRRHCVLVVSGRASFELIQKALMAGIPMVAAIGAPSSLAVAMAAQHGLTLVGFLRNQQASLYTHHERIAR